MLKIKTTMDATKFVNLIKNDRLQFRVDNGEYIYYLTKNDNMPDSNYRTELEEYDRETGEFSSREFISFDDSVEWVYANKDSINREIKYQEDLRFKIKEGVYDFRTIVEKQDMVMLLHYIDIEKIKLSFDTREGERQIERYKSFTFSTRGGGGTYTGVRFYDAVSLLRRNKATVLSSLEAMFSDYADTQGTKYDTVVLQRLLRETEPTSFLKYIHENGMAVKYGNGVSTRLIIPLKGTDYLFKSIIHSKGTLKGKPTISELNNLSDNLSFEGIPFLTKENFFEAEDVLKEKIVMYSKPLEIQERVITASEPKKSNNKVHLSLIINSDTGEVLGVAGIQTGLKIGGKLLHTGDVVKYLNENRQIATGMVILHKNMITISGVLDKPLSSIKLDGYVSRYYANRGFVDLNGLKVLFKRITV